MYPFDTFWYNEADKKYVFVKSFWNSDKNFQNIREVKLNNKMFLKCTLTAHKNIVLTIIPTVLKKGYEDSYSHAVLKLDSWLQNMNYAEFYKVFYVKNFQRKSNNAFGCHYVC